MLSQGIDRLMQCGHPREVALPGPAVAPHRWQYTSGSSRLHPLLIDSVGRRALGVYASQLAAVARLFKEEKAGQTVTIDATGPRNAVIALVAAALETETISSLELRQSWETLKRLIEENISGGDMPELFCFGLLKEFDIIFNVLNGIKKAH